MSILVLNYDTKPYLLKFEDLSGGIGIVQQRTDYIVTSDNLQSKTVFINSKKEIVYTFKMLITWCYTIVKIYCFQYKIFFIKITKAIFPDDPNGTPDFTQYGIVVRPPNRDLADPIKIPAHSYAFFKLENNCHSQ